MRKNRQQQTTDDRGRHQQHEQAVRWTLAATGALLLAVFLAPLIAGGFQANTAAIIRFLILASAGLLLTYFVLSREAYFLNTSLTVPTLLFLGISALSVIWSISRYSSLVALLELLCEILFVYLLIHLMVTRPRIYWLIGALAAATLLVCTRGISEYMTHAKAEWLSMVAAHAASAGPAGFLQYLLTNAPDWRIFGPFFNPNIFADFLIVVAPITLSRYLLSEDRAWALMYGFLLVLDLVALLLTASKGAMAALVVAMGVYGILAWWMRAPMGPRAVSRLLTIGFVILVLGSLFARPLLNRVGAATGGEAHSGVFRAYLWRSTLNIIREHPLGTGLGTFKLAYPKYALVGNTEAAHNNYLQIASEVGIPGLIAFLLILLLLARTVITALITHRRGDAPRHSMVPLLMIGFASGVCASALHSAVDYAWYIPATALMFWLAVAMTQVTSGTADPRPIRFGPVAWGVGIALILAVMWLNTRIGMGAWDASMAWDLELQGQYREALAQRQSALEEDPWNPEFHHRLARLLPASGMLDPAIDEIDRSIAMEPCESRFWMTKAHLLSLKNDSEGARKAYLEAAKQDPNSDEIWRQLAELEAREGRTRESERAWRQVVKIEESPVGRWPAIPELVNSVPARAHAVLARFAAKQHRWKEAIGHYQRAERILSAYQGSEKDYRYQAMREIGQNDPEEAKELAALRVNLLEELVEVYRASGDTAAAKKTQNQLERQRALQNR